MKRVIAFCILLSACGPDASEFTRAQLSQAIQTNPDRIVISKYVTGPWDRVCLFPGPYHAEPIQLAIGFAWPEVLDTGIETSRDHSLMLFIRGQEVMQSVMFKKSAGYFDTYSHPCFSRDSAVFRVLNKNVKYYRKLGVAQPQPPQPGASLAAADELGIMAAAADYVSSMSGGYDARIDPGSHRAVELGKATNRPVQGENDVKVCTDPMDARSCTISVDQFVRVGIPQAIGADYLVNVDLIRRVPAQPWRTETRTKEVVVGRDYAGTGWQAKQMR